MPKIVRTVFVRPRSHLFPDTGPSPIGFEQVGGRRPVDVLCFGKSIDGGEAELWAVQASETIQYTLLKNLKAWFGS